MEPLTDPVNQLPHFMPNRVLTDTQLNGVVDYLEQQERFTRQRLIGIGIVCGLQADLIDVEGQSIVEISAGVGVTSCGYLINVPDMLQLSLQRDFTTNNYDLFTGIDFLELFPSDTATEGVSVFTAEQTDNKIVVLFLDVQDKPNGKCIGENCDEKGNSWVFALRVLLMDKDDAAKILVTANELYSNEDLEPYFNDNYMLPTVFIERFSNTTFGNTGNYADVDFDLGSVITYDQFEAAYKTIILNAAVRVANAIADAYDVTSTAFSATGVFVTQLGSTNPFAGFENITVAANTLAQKLSALLDVNNASYKKGNCQYLYDFVRDLFDTYHELRDELFAYFANCCPPSTIFPKHLNLGDLKTTVFGQLNADDYATPSYYRHYFVPSHTETAQAIYLKKIKQLIQRLQLQIQSLDFSNILTDEYKTEFIQIIPDKTCAEALGNRNIPFYYSQRETNLYRYWNFDKMIQHRSYENRSYFSKFYQFPNSFDQGTTNRTFIESPVFFDLCKYPKLSIQGHVGKSLLQTIQELQDLRSQYNLSFDLLTLKLNSLKTGVYIADENLVADLQAQYLALRNETACCLEELITYIEKEKSILTLMLSYMFYFIAASGNDQSTLDFQEIEYYVNIVLGVYIEALQLMVESLPTSITDFRFQKLYDVYPIVTTFTSIFKLIINVWGDLETFIVAINTDDKTKIPGSEMITVFLDMWELYLNKISDDCILSAFLTIHELYKERITSFSYFSEFNKVIHGMEHIAGTNYGGSFILVYEDVEDTISVTGEVFSEFDKGLQHVEIVSAKDPAVVYGKTDRSGKYSINVPRDEQAIQFRRAGHVVEEKQITGKKLSGTKMYTHNYFTDQENWEQPPTIDKTDTLYVQLIGATNKLKAMQFSSASQSKTSGITMSDYVPASSMNAILKHFNKPSENFESVVIANRDDFKVVADFYLPHPIHNYKVALPHYSSCEYLRTLKMIDFTEASAVVSGYMKKARIFDNIQSTMFNKKVEALKTETKIGK